MPLAAVNLTALAAELGRQQAYYLNSMDDEGAAPILKWLHRTGYPLELRVGWHLQAIGWHVNYGRRYIDRETKKT